MRDRSPIKAVLTALFAMWLVNCLALFVLFRVSRWSIGFLDNPGAVFVQMGGFYLAFFAVQIVGVCIAARILLFSSISHPVKVTGWCIFLFQMLRFGVNLPRNPLLRVPEIPWWLPIGFESIGILVLTLVSMGLVRLWIRVLGLNRVPRDGDLEG